MCGRFTLVSPSKAVKELFPLFDAPAMPSRYNIAPTQEVAVVRQNPATNRPELTMMRWGLVPFWADDPKIGGRLINARSETAATKPAFRDAFEKRHCLVLADGFFEWKKDGKQRWPYHIRRKDGQPFAFAGLWEKWKKGPEPIHSCTVLTTDANDLVRPLHDRMPVILDRGDFARWLGGALSDYGDLLRPYPAERMAAVPVNTVVNNARRDDPSCLAAPEEEKPEPARELF